MTEQSLAYTMRIEIERLTAENERLLAYTRELEARIAAPMPVASEPVAWMGYWPGAGSVNSTTELTRFRSTMENWKGAEITPLYASPQPTFNDGVEAAAKLIEGGIDRGIRTKRDTCKHNRFGWEDCELCAVDAIRALKEHHP